MDIRTETRAEAVILILEGRLTLGPSATALRAEIEKAIANKAPSVILDLNKLIYVDSAGLGALAAGLAQSKAAGIGFGVAAPRPRVLEAIELVCLNRVLQIHTTLDAALAKTNSPLGSVVPTS